MTYWKDDLLVGVTKIDEQHRKLVMAIDELMEACNNGQGRATIGKTLAFVDEYTKVHFSDEEKMQMQYMYPDMNNHKQMHKQFINNIELLIDDLEKNGPNIALTGKINKTLVDWLIRHISIEDKKLSEHIRSKDK